MGHSARASQNIKVRQPLGGVLVHLSKGTGDLDAEMTGLVIDELNVKGLQFVGSAEELVDYRVLPNNKILGPRFGSRFPAVRAALSSLDPLDVTRRVKAGLPVTIVLDDGEEELAAEDVMIQEQAREGLAVVSEYGITVAVDVKLTPELLGEGLAREVIRRVQNLRKEADFNLDDRIVTTYSSDDELSEAVEAWRDYIMAETLSVELHSGEPEEGTFQVSEQVAGHELTLGVQRIDVS
jgi:isoleucyl-tRNA synthetase